MKQKISVTIEEDLINIIENMLADNNFRNRSHMVEVAINKFVEGDRK